MNTLRNKFVSAALTGAMMLSTAGVALPVAHAQSVADLQAQIAALLAQIQQLQSQLSGISGGAGVAVSCSFSRDLTLGSTGDDANCLQRYLNSSGYQVAASGAGSPGSESSYFGSLTQAALAKWQAANGVAPAAGYFGPISRAKYASLAGGAAPGVPVPGAPASGLAVGLAAENPPAGSLVSSAASAAARVPVLAVNLTAGVASGITVNELRFNKIGVLSDSSISGAYLEESGRVVAQYSSLASGVLSFSGLNLSVAAGQTRRLWLTIDPAIGLSAGNTVGFGVSAASNVMAVDAAGNAAAASGAFPLNGNMFTVTSVSNPSLAALTVASSSIGTEVTAGTSNNLVGAWNFSVTNSQVHLRSVNFRVTGSANRADIRNVALKVNGNQVGPMLAQVGADGNAFFDASANPGVLNTGSNNIQVFADISGSPSFDFRFQILNSYDILAVDSQYNVPIGAQSNSGTSVSIRAGSITVSQASDTPTGNVVAGQSGVTLARFTIFAGGEALRVRFLGVGLDITGGTEATIDGHFRNLALIDDAGGQLGTTINTLSQTATCTSGGGASGFSASTSTYENCFGSSGSPINYIVPANTTRVLSLRADIETTADFSSVVGRLTGNSSNLQGVTSAQTASSGPVSGASRTRAATSLTISQNTALGTQNLAANASGLRIGSYAFSASSAEGVTINNISVQANSPSWTNLRLMIDGAQFGSTQGTVASGSVSSFSGSFSVSAGQTRYVDAYADSISGAVSSSPATILTECTGSGLATFRSIVCTDAGVGAPVTGQTVVFAGAATLEVAVDSATPSARQVVMGSSGSNLAIFRFTETSNVEDVKITDLFVFQQVGSTTTVLPSFGNLGIYNSAGSLLASAGTLGTHSATSTGPGFGYFYKFSFGSNVVVPKSGSLSLTLKGDAATFSSGGATDVATHTFKVATSTDASFDTAAEAVVALGSTSNIAASASGFPANANAQQVVRSKLTVSATPLGSTSARAKSSVDDLADINFAADAAGGVRINSVTVTFSGSAPSGSFFGVGTSVVLRDTSAGTNFALSATTSASLSFDLGGYQLSAGTSKSFRLRANSLSSEFNVAGSGVSVTLAATIDVAGDVTWSTALSGGSAATLESYLLPIQIQSVSYAQGT